MCSSPKTSSCDSTAPVRARPSGIPFIIAAILKDTLILSLTGRQKIAFRETHHPKKANSRQRTGWLSEVDSPDKVEQA